MSFWFCWCFTAMLLTPPPIPCPPSQQRGMFTKPLPIISVTQENKAPLFCTCHSCHALFRMNCTDGRLESPISSESSIQTVTAESLVRGEAVSGVTFCDSRSSERASSVTFPVNYFCTFQWLHVIKTWHAVGSD